MENRAAGPRPHLQDDESGPATQRDATPHRTTQRNAARCGPPSRQTGQHLVQRDGKSRTRTPQALNTALATAAPAPLMPSSPMPLIFSGLVLSSTSGRNTASMAGMSACTGTWYSARSWLTNWPWRGSTTPSSVSAAPTPQIIPPSACERAVLALRMRPAAKTPSMRRSRTSPDSVSTATSAKKAP